MYRGVGEDINPKTIYAAAKRGIAVPKGFAQYPYQPHNNPDDHTMSDNHSTFTSWTPNKGMAKYFAAGPAGTSKGVVLTKTFKRSELIRSAYAYLMQEDEYLAVGVVTGASVENVDPIKNRVMKSFCLDAWLLLCNHLDDQELSVLGTDLEYRVVKVNRMQTIGTYAIRARIHENNQALSKQFTSLLKTLKETLVEFVMIHAVVVRTKLYLFFTNESNSSLFGYLIFSDGDSKEVNKEV